MARAVVTTATASDISTPGARAVGSDAGPGATVAAAAGVAVHKALQALSLRGDLGAELAEQARRTEDFLPEGLDRDAARQAAGLARQQLAQLTGSRIIERLGRVSGHVLGREVPLVLWQTVEPHPAQGITGAIDLVYRDPDTGETVLVDYKTDRMAAEADRIHARAERYRGQLECYRSALQQALRSARKPRVELWFVWPDVIVTLEPRTREP